VDALPSMLDYVDSGLVPVLLAQPTYDWGYKSVGFIIDKVSLGKKVDVINKMELFPVDKPGLKDWAQKLRDWGFKGDTDKKILDKYTK
jgi:ribose transport system substrate-binding protein